MAEISVDSSEDPTPICRCRVLYMGSAVPHITKDGLQGIQEPLKELYPEQGAFEARGIDSWLSVWSNGILLENVDENHKKITRFFPIETLHFCAAVRYVLVPERNNPATPRFLPLDSPFAHGPNPNHPPLFAAILRRTSGIKVLECHAFISKVEAAANALVRCCFHAYADSSYAKQIDERNIYGTVRSSDTIDRVEGWRRKNRSEDGSQTLPNNNGTAADYASTMCEQQITLPDEMSIYNGDENHKVWAGVSVQGTTYNQSEYNSTLRSQRASRPRQAISYFPPPLPPAREYKKRNDHRGSPSATMRPAQSMTNMNRQDHGRQNGRNIRHLPPPHMYYGPPQILNNGAVMPPMYNSSTMRPGQGPMPIPSLIPIYNNGASMAPPIFNGATMPPPPLMFRPHPSTLPHPRSKRKAEQYAGTFSHRDQYNRDNRIKVYMPLPPGTVHNHSVRIPIPTTNGKRKNKSKNKMYQPIPAHQPYDRPRMPPLTPNLSVDDEEPLPGNGNGNGNDDESPFNTGIYRKKGHLNERAFSYSIRQEHRSRSYGSLANLQFAPPIPNEPIKSPPPQPLQTESRSRSFGSLENLGVRSPPRKKLTSTPAPGKIGARRERDLIQIMNDLDISGDELERSEVPKSVYESKRLAAVKANAAKHRK